MCGCLFRDGFAIFFHFLTSTNCLSHICRFLTENSESLVLDLDLYLEQIEAAEDKAALNFVNALEDLLWAFELRATASWVFQLAIKRSIYHNDIFRYIDLAAT